MRRARSLKLIAGLAAAGLALAACSSGSSSTTQQHQRGDVGGAASSAAVVRGWSQRPASRRSRLRRREMTGDPAAVKLGLAYDIGGRGDQSFNDLAAKSLDEAKAAGVDGRRRADRRRRASRTRRRSTG